MTLPIEHIVDINVSLSAGGVSAVSFGVPLGVFAHSVNADRVSGPFSSLAEMVDAGFTSGAAADVHAWGGAMFSQESEGHQVSQVKVGLKAGGDASYTEALDAIEAEDDEWYGLTIASRTKADIVAATSWVGAREKIGLFQTADADVLTDGTDNVAATLAGTGSHRAALVYHPESDEYLDGAWMSRCLGFDLDAEGGAGIWAHKSVVGPAPTKFTTAQANNIWANNANLYGRVRGVSLTADGTMASGRYIDITTSLDWFKARSEEAILSEFKRAQTKVPGGNAGINHLRAALYAVMDLGVSARHISPNFPRVVNAPDITEVATADRETRHLRMTGGFTLDNGWQKVTFNANVTQ